MGSQSRNSAAGSAVVGTERAGGRRWEDRPRGGERGEGCTPGLSRAPAQLQERILRLSGHGVADPSTLAASGAAVAAASSTATGAEPGALPCALQLPARRRPALSWPAGWPHPTVSTNPLPGTLAGSWLPCLHTLCPLYLES